MINFRNRWECLAGTLGCNNGYAFDFSYFGGFLGPLALGVTLYLAGVY